MYNNYFYVIKNVGHHARKAASKESCHRNILLPITCYYAQYRMHSAILRNHL